VILRGVACGVSRHVVSIHVVEIFLERCQDVPHAILDAMRDVMSKSTSSTSGKTKDCVYGGVWMPRDKKRAPAHFHVSEDPFWGGC
jgi:hypothetical protein